MGLFDKLFKKESTKKQHKGFYELTISKIEKVTTDTVKVTLNLPTELKQHFNFVPGQYINFIIESNGKEERRSYSICSGPNEQLAVAVKAIENGNISVWFNTLAQEGTIVNVSKPEGNFKLDSNSKTIVAFAAGSGITPIVSIAKSIHNSDKKMTLFYGNRNIDSIILKNDLDAVSNMTTNYYLTAEKKEGYFEGRIDKSTMTEAIKQDLNLLKADGYFLCGPEEMIIDIVEILKMFGVAKEKIHYELFTTPTLLKNESSEEISTFKGESNVKVILDGESIEFKLKSDGKPILDILDKEGFDAPYSCRGGVCCSCKAKVISGKASMKLNYVLTDQEVKDGYILVCQSHPASEDLTISFDA
ncbi:MAG: 2Fe-2S iron-sulfur cluster binding domain-containing protein [Flavobacteriia bacterium]|nr:2Fe-2S iron-sulfur cluster binding domain-containing protein [Flavobacteriia bacterium]